MFIPNRQSLFAKLTISLQFLLSVSLHHRLHALPACHCVAAQRIERANHCTDTRLQCAWPLVARGRRQHPRRQRRSEEQGLAGRVPALCLLRRSGLSLLYLLSELLPLLYYRPKLLRRARCECTTKRCITICNHSMMYLPTLIQHAPLQSPHITSQTIHVQATHLLAHGLRPAFQHVELLLHLFIS